MYPGPSRQLGWRLFVTLVNTFQPLTNFTRNSSIGTVGVLNAPLEYYNGICAGDEIKYCKTVAYNFSKYSLFHSLVNYLI